MNRHTPFMIDGTEIKCPHCGASVSDTNCYGSHSCLGDEECLVYTFKKDKKTGDVYDVVLTGIDHTKKRRASRSTGGVID